MNTTNKLLSISDIEGLEEKRDLASLDKVIEQIYINLNSIDNIMSSNYVKSNFEAIIFDFVKNEHLIYIRLNSKCRRSFQSIEAVSKYNNELKIVNETLEEYYKDCNSFFEKKITPLFKYFLNRFSNRLINYTNEKPSKDEKKQVFENLLNELKKETDYDVNKLITELKKYRE